MLTCYTQTYKIIVKRTNKQKQMHNQKFIKTRLHCKLLDCLQTPTYQFAGLVSHGAGHRERWSQWGRERTKEKVRNKHLYFFVKVIISNWRVRISNIDKIYALGIDYQFWLKMLTTNFEFWYWLSLFMQSDTASFLVVIEQNGRHTDQVALAHLKICFT